MVISINVDQLDQETRQKLNIAVDPDVEAIPERLIILGRIMTTLKGMTISDGVWVLNQALSAITDQKPPVAEIPGIQQSVVTAGLVMEIVAHEYGVDVIHLLGRSRESTISEARQVVFFYLWQNQLLTLTEIGRVFNRSAATVSHGYQTIANRCRKEGRTNRTVNRIIKLINNMKGSGNNGESCYL